MESDPCVPCRLLPSAQFPRGLQSPFWFSVRAKQSNKNSHRRSAAHSWLSGKSSFPNFCIFSLLSSRAGAHSFEGFSILLEEMAHGSFSGLIVIPLASTGRRAKNSPELYTGALELCVMALDVWCKCLPSSPFFFVAPEDRGGRQQHGPASIWQLAEVLAIVKRTREATRSSAFACELRAAVCPRPLAFISNLCHLSPRLVQGWPRLQRKGDFLKYSGPLRHNCACGKDRRTLPRGQFATPVLPLFPVGFWSTVLEATRKTLRDGVSIPKGSDHGCRDEAKAILGYSSSPWFTRLVPCLLLPSAQFPRGLQTAFWFSVRAKQSNKNSHRRSAAHSWLSGKSSFPNFCIFPSCHLGQEQTLLKVSPFCWKKWLTVHSLVSS